MTKKPILSLLLFVLFDILSYIYGTIHAGHEQYRLEIVPNCYFIEEDLSMAKEKKVKSPEHVGFKEMFGVTALSTNNGLAAIFMSTMFMIYMTDYAGLGA